MKSFQIFYPLSLLLFFSSLTLSQNPGEPYNPETANGAKGIGRNNHILVWHNPSLISYNKIYFSADSLSVANSDTSTLILNGYPSTVYSNVTLNFPTYLEYYKKYFWKIIEFDTNGDSTNGTM